MKYTIDSKFIKDISFEIPTATTYLMLEKEISKYNLTFEIQSKQLKKNIIEVSTILKLLTDKKIERKINVEINMSALVTIEGDLQNKEELKKIILIKVPSDIYPSLYETFVFLFSKSGIKDINIKKNVDFEELYNKKK